MPSKLNIFPARVAIGQLQPDGTVLMTLEFSRALSDLMVRVGGPSAMTVDELAALAESEVATGMIQALRAEVTALRAELETTQAALAQVARLAHVEQLKREIALIEDPAEVIRYILTRFAPLKSPTFTGTPTAPTAAIDTNTDQLATTKFVLAQAAASNPVANGVANPGTSTRYARADHVHPTDNTRQAAITKGTVTGSRAGNAALASLLSVLAGQNLITDSTTT